MALIKFESAKLSFGKKILFENISFSINEGNRIALVGNNGCGKSSLVKALMGLHELDNGQITKKRGLQIGYVAQEISSEIEKFSCYEFLLNVIPPESQSSDSWKVDVALNELGLLPELWNKPIKTLSGGWRRLLLIAQATLCNPDILILDEPTNHLDLGKIFKLEDWLISSLRIPYLVISHDREFLEKCTNKTLFMRSDGIHEFGTTFSVARNNLLQADALNAKQREREESEIKRIERAAARLKEWGIRAPQSDLTRKGQVLQSRADRIREKQTEIYSEKKRDISLHYDEITSNAIALVQNVNITTPDGRLLFKIGRFSLKQGERVCILGLNGAGKSVFIQQFIDALKNYEPGPAPENGFWFSPQVRLGYLDQHLETLPIEKTITSFLSDRFSLNHTQIVRELVHIGFPIEVQNSYIKNISAGEKARLALLSLRLAKPNFYVLDEPTNHLDIQGQEDLEEELDDKGHSCIFVSHDRRLIRGATTRFVEIRNGKLLEVENPEPFFKSLRDEE